MPLAQRKARHAKFSAVFVYPEDPASGKDFNVVNIWSMYCRERQVLVLSVRRGTVRLIMILVSFSTRPTTQVRASVGLHKHYRPSNHRPLYLF
jgi:hypothetical protein